MKDVMNLLDRFYNGAINQKDDCQFLINATHYFQLCCKNKHIAPFLVLLKEQNDELVKGYCKFEKEVIEEVEKIEEEFSEKIKDFTTDRVLKNRIKDYQDIQLDKITSNLGKALDLIEAMEEIFERLFTLGYEDIIKDYVSFYENPKIIKDSIFRDYKNELVFFKKRYNEFTDTQPFGAFLKLQQLNSVMHDYDNLLNQTLDKKLGYQKIGSIDLALLKQDLSFICKKTKYPVSVEKDSLFWNRDNIQAHLTRLHNYLVSNLIEFSTGLELEKSNNTPKNVILPINSLKYDNSSKTLFINEHPIIIAKRADSTAHNVLKLIMIDQQFDYSEVYKYYELAGYLDDTDYDKRSEGQMRYYKAIMSINEKVFKQTKSIVDDLFICKYHDFCLNKRYIKRKRTST